MKPIPRVLSVVVAVVTVWPPLGAAAQPSPPAAPPAAPPPAAPQSPPTTAAAPAATTAPAEAVESDRLLAVIKSLPTKRAARGNHEHQEGLFATEELVVARLEALGYKPTLEVVDAIGLGRDKARPYHNIIVEIKGRGGAPGAAGSTPVPPRGAPPANPAAVSPGAAPGSGPSPSAPSASPAAPATTPSDAAPGLLIVGAHIDAVPRAPGADDNGTGVAALLELARILKDRPMKHDVRLCFFNLEECGLVGSTVHAAAVKDAILTPATQRIIGMMSLDMLGVYSDAPGSQKSPIPAMEGFTPPDVADFIAMATVLRHRKFSQALTKAMKECAPGLKVVTVDFLPIALPDLLRSDHAPFLAIGVPAVIISDTANFRSNHYHQPTDTIDTLDMPRFTLTVRGIVGAVHRLAEPIERSSSNP